MVEIPFCGESYKDRSGSANAQECINFYPFKSPTPENKDRVILYPTPGFLSVLLQTVPAYFAFRKLLHNPGFDMIGQEVRGLLNINDVVYMVVGNRFISMPVTGGVVAGVGAITGLGTLNSYSGRVHIVTNTVDVTVTDDLSGYVYNIATGAFAQIDNSGAFPVNGVTNITFIDDYYVAMVKNSRQVIVSDLLDGLTWSALSTQTVTSFPDDGIGVFSDQNQLYVFGRQVTEVQFDAGTIPYPFEKVSGVLIQAGCIAIDTVVKVGSTTMWLANDIGESPFVAALLGYSIVPISSPALNEAMARYTSIADAFAYTYREADDHFYVITFPIAGATWAYSLKGKMWHQRQYNGGADLVNCCTYVNYQRSATGTIINHMVGDTLGNLWIMSQDWSQVFYNGVFSPLSSVPTFWPPIRTRVGPHFRQGRKKIFMNMVEVNYEAGVGVNNTSPTDISGDTITADNPQATLFASKDEGKTWINLGSRPMGGTGKYRYRMIWRNLGWSWVWTFKLVISDPVKTYILGMDADFKLGK